MAVNPTDTSVQGDFTVHGLAADTEVSVMFENRTITSAAGQCSDPSCTPTCDGKQCGSDGCGVSCGVCAPGTSCSGEGQCLGLPDIGGGDDGSTTDGCGGGPGGDLVFALFALFGLVIWRRR